MFTMATAPAFLLVQDGLSTTWTEYVPFVVTATAVVLVLSGAWVLVERSERFRSGRQLVGQAVMMALSLGAFLALIVALPIDRELRAQLLAFFAILFSAAIALASTTFLGNLLAGFMLRTIRNFRVGDFIRCEGYFGRVTQRGLLHVEIQTEDRDLTTLANQYLINHPTTTIRSSGTIVSTTVTLGYDVPRGTVHDRMHEAARKAGLSESFFQVLELGDFSITYRISGLLTEIKEIFTARTRLREEVLDALHGSGIEVVSPNFMNTRSFDPDATFIPHVSDSREKVRETTTLEDLAFDKAEVAETLQNMKDELEGVLRDCASAEKSLKEAGDDVVARKPIEDELLRLSRRKAELEQAIQAEESRLAGEPAKT